MSNLIHTKDLIKFESLKKNLSEFIDDESELQQLIKDEMFAKKKLLEEKAEQFILKFYD